MNYRQLLCVLCCFFLPCSPLMAQTQVQVSVLDNYSARPLNQVAIYNTKGDLLGKTNKYGQVQITIRSFPVFLQKEGYPTQYAYDIKDLQPAMMHRMGGEIPTVTIRPGITDSLLALRDINKAYFNQRDTTLYYHFNYSLTLPDDDWEESAEGYIAVNFRGIGVSPSSFNAYRYAYIIQFDYHNERIELADTKPLPVNKIMPVVLMFGEDLMGGYGYPLWRSLTSSYLERYQRSWQVDKDSTGNRVFTSYSMDTDNRLMEALTFDPRNRLQQVVFYNPEGIHAVGPVDIFSNFSKDNGVNSFRTVYRYSDSDSNRILTSLTHLSTFYKPLKTYYKMKFSASLSSTIPEQTCQIPLFYLSHNHYHKEQNGYGVWLLLQEHYKIKRDRWVAIQDREQQQIEKELQRVREEQEEQAKDTTDRKGD